MEEFRGRSAGRLLGAQGDERVDAYRASRGDITGHEGHTEEQRWNAQERCRIEGAHAEQDHREHSRCDHAEREANGGANGGASAERSFNSLRVCRGPLYRRTVA